MPSIQHHSDQLVNQQKRTIRIGLALLSAVLSSLLLQGCARTDHPSNHWPTQSYIDSMEPGVGFLHRTLLSTGTAHIKEPGQRSLRVYIEGDGRPWITPIQKARDPTPIHPVALRMMQLDDTAHRLFLGRPCYFSTADPLCQSPDLWTSARYSAEIVASMNRVLDRYARDYEHLTLIGFSGGGTLAYLMTSQRSDISQLITVAANLDIDAWADLHGFSRLQHSINPSRQPSLPDRVRQIHLSGADDDNAPANLFPAFLQRQTNVQLRTIKGFDHNCCWLQLWPDFLSDLNNFSGR